MFQTQATSTRSGRGSWFVGLAAVGLWIAAPVFAGGQLQQRPSSPTAKSSSSGSSSSSSGASRSSGSSRSSAGSSNRGGSSRGTSAKGGGSSRRSGGSSANRGGSSRGSGGSSANRGGSSRGTGGTVSSSRPSTRPSGPNRKWRDSVDHRAPQGQAGRQGETGTPTKYRDRKWHPDNNPRTHRPTHRRHDDYYYPFYGGYPYYGGYGHFGHYGRYSRYSPFWSYTFYGNYRYPAPWYPHQSYEGRELGGLDLNVRPKTTEVYLNGNFVGEAGNFDGYPRYLWLEDGVYEVILYLDGYQTVVREIEVVTGVVIDVQEKMEPGQAVLPEELSVIQPADDERVEVGTEWWREASAQAPPPGLEPGSAPVIDARAKPGRIRLTVAPADASVYLDGHFVGTGRDLVGGEAAALLVDAGEHVLEIVHPRHESRKVEIEVDAGEEVEVDLGLGEEKSAAL